MSPGGRASVSIVPFSEDWIEGYLDLSERNDAVDPLYERPPRDAMRARALSRLERSPSQAGTHLLAVREGRVVGSARAVVIPGCGGQEKPATLSLVVSPESRRAGIGTRLLERVCAEMKAQGVRWIEIGILDDWVGCRRFLEARGFTPHERTADVVLPARVRVPDRLPVTDARIRPVRLPEDREKVLGLFNRERGEDLPKECAVPPGQPAWWEVEPYAGTLDPGGFLVAEDADTGVLVGYVSSNLMAGEPPSGLIHYVDVTRERVGTGLREGLLVQVVRWLRGNGVATIRSRVHLGFRDEDGLFARLGFETENRATVWRRRILPLTGAQPPGARTRPRSAPATAAGTSPSARRRSRRGRT